MTIWIERAEALAIHEEQLSEHGGATGLRDENALVSALERARNLDAYGDPPPDLAGLAAAYAFGIARNHPFVDGNKRTSAVVTETFLLLDGQELTATDEEMLVIWLAIASGTMEEDMIARWIRDRLASVAQPPGII